MALEEPEAHVHPHIQRSIFSYFLSHEKNSAEDGQSDLIDSLLITTHSPHIVSVTPLRSIILLKNLTSESGTTAHKINKNLFTNEEVKDIERYIDVTRGELFFSRGIIFVEGIAEQFLIPKIAESMGISLDHLGISVIAVHGTDFKPFVKLVGYSGLNIPFVVITDGDSHLLDNPNSLLPGMERCIHLMKVIIKRNLKDEELKIRPIERTSYIKSMSHRLMLKQRGFFVGQHTLETDLLPFYPEEFLKIYGYFVSRKSTLEDFKQLIEDAIANDSDSATRLVNRIADKGKGRFAQKLSLEIQPNKYPIYIKEAIEYIVDKLKQSSPNSQNRAFEETDDIPF